MKRAVFLDRDGVLNRAYVRDGKPYPPNSVEQMEIVPEAPDALRILKAHGLELVVVTNQPDVSRGTQEKAKVEAIHRELARVLPLDAIMVCYHSDEDGCDCRKPAPGMLQEAARERSIDLAASFMVGDRWRDIEAGHNAGCKTILIDYGYRERGADPAPDVTVRSLREAADWIIDAMSRDSCSESINHGA